MEMHFARMMGLRFPASVRQSLFLQNVQSILQPFIVWVTDTLEVIERAQNIVAPTRRIDQFQKTWMDDCAGVVGFVQTVPQKEFLSFAFDLLQFIQPIGITGCDVLPDALKDAERGMHRTVPGTGTVQPAIEAAIGQLLADDEIHHRPQLFLFRPEVAGIVQEHAVDADIALLDAFCRIDAAISAR